MAFYIKAFLKTEITCIPHLLTKYLGDYYNNTLCNASTWMFVLWFCLHAIFNTFLNAFLRKLRLKEYVRDRLLSSLWYFGFFGTSFVYCGAVTLIQNDVELFNFKKMAVPSIQNELPSQLLGYLLMSTFYFHSALWEGLNNNKFLTMCSFVLLAFFMVVSYILRIVEISFTLSGLISLAKISLEIIRFIVLLSNHSESFTRKCIFHALWASSLIIFVGVYLFVIPLTFVVPMGLQILSDYPNTLFLLLYFILTSWLVIEIYNSILFKTANHWLYHTNTKGTNSPSCSGGNIVDCSIFSPRDDATFNLNLLRQEMKQREAQMMSLRKPKNRNMLIQTLKCMMAIKRKLNEKHSNENSDSDDSQEGEVEQKLENFENRDNGGEESDDNDDDDEEEEIEKDENIT